MIRLSANLSKKVPIPGLEFSSQQFGASLEVEISDADKAEAIQAKIRDLYDLLNKSVNAQIVVSGYQGEALVEHSNAAASPSALPANRLPARGQAQHQNSNGNGIAKPTARRGPAKATAAQVRAIHAIAKAVKINLVDFLANFNVVSPEELHVKDASRLIDELKATQSNGSH